MDHVRSDAFDLNSWRSDSCRPRSMHAWFTSSNGEERPVWTYPNYPDDSAFLTDCDIANLFDKRSCKEITAIGENEFLVVISYYRHNLVTERYFKRLVWFEEYFNGHELLGEVQ
jgi:hypothetical protein